MDPRFDLNPKRTAEREALRAVIAEAFATLMAEEVIGRLVNKRRPRRGRERLVVPAGPPAEEAEGRCALGSRRLTQ